MLVNWALCISKHLVFLCWKCKWKRTTKNLFHFVSHHRKWFLVISCHKASCLPVCVRVCARVCVNFLGLSEHSDGLLCCLNARLHKLTFVLFLNICSIISINTIKPQTADAFLLSVAGVSSLPVIWGNDRQTLGYLVFLHWQVSRLPLLSSQTSPYRWAVSRWEVFSLVSSFLFYFYLSIVQHWEDFKYNILGQ